MSFKDLMAKERTLKEKPSSESNNLAVKSSSEPSSSCDSDSKKK